MKHQTLVGLALASIIGVCPSLPRAQTPPRPGFVVTLDGGGFSSKQFTLTPVAATYSNNLWRSSRDPRIDRIDLASYDRPGTELKFGVAPALGTSAFDKSDEDRDDHNPYRRFDLLIQEPGAADARSFRPDHVEVVVTRLDPVGGRIEGTIRGTLEGAIKIDGRFSVVRGRDRVVD